MMAGFTLVIVGVNCIVETDNIGVLRITLNQVVAVA